MKIQNLSHLKKLLMSTAFILAIGSSINAHPFEKDKKTFSIRDQVKKQLSIPSSLSKKGMNEKAYVTFQIEGEKIISYNIETTNQKLKENLSVQFEKIKFKAQQGKADGSYRILLTFQVI
jgi:hypothetical protein